MKFGFRIPSIRKRIAARTSVKRFIRHNLGVKAPRGFGWLTDPRRALKNRIYSRTTFGIEDLFRARRRPGCLVLIAGGIFWYLVAEGVHAFFFSNS